MKKIITSIFLSCLTAGLFGQANTYFHDRIDTTIFGVADTIGHGSNNYVVTNTSSDFNVKQYVNGLAVNVFIKHGNTGTSTLKLITRTGTLLAKTIENAGGLNLLTGDIKDSSIVLFTYYNNRWHCDVNGHANANDWLLLGNAGTVSGTNFIGTTDSVDFVFKVNNRERGRINRNGGSWTLGATGITHGKLIMKGLTSGSVTVTPAAAAGSWTFTLPIDDGTPSQFLQTDGSGITSWQTVTPATIGAWSITGNAGTTAGTNFLGTTDAQDVVFKRNSNEVMRLYSANNFVGIGTATPSTILDVTGSGGIQCKAVNGDVAMELRDHNGAGLLYVWDQSRIDILNAGTQVSNFTQGKLIINGGGDLTAHGVFDCRGDMESRYTGAAATVGNQIINSSYHFWVGSHWNGASGIDNSFFMFDSTTSTTTQSLIWGTGDAFPSGTERMRLTGTGILSIGSATPSASAKLQVSSTTQGFLPPVMTGAQGEAISSPATGLLIYATSAGGGDITSSGWWGWNGSNWVKLN